MNTHIGYTSEKFRIEGTKIYKYTTDPKRIEFLKSQMLHLIEIGKVLPLNVPSDITWKETETEWGYTMEYIMSYSRLENDKIESIVNIIKDCSKIYHPKSIPTFETFIQYLSDVLDKNKSLFSIEDWHTLKEKYLNELVKNSEAFNKETSSSHGDFTMENILVSEDRIVLIDCILKEGLWTSWLLDTAKFYQNIYFNDSTKTFLFTQKLSSIVSDNSEVLYHLIYLLMISNYIRMFPYLVNKREIFDIRYKEFKFLIDQL